MDIKALLEQVRSQIGDEAVAKVGSALKEIEAGVNDLADTLKAANAESKSRKTKIRELEESKSDLEAQIETLKKNDNSDELNTLREFKQNYLKSQRENLGREIEKIGKHPNFTKAEKLLKLPQADDKGQRDYAKMSDGDLEFNLAKLQELQALDYFSGGNDSAGGRQVHGAQEKLSPQTFQERLAAAKSVQDLEKIQEEMSNG